jgi:tRNA 2-thiouridine synthesizing protein A
MHYQLDAKRLLCPMPVIRTQDMVKTLQVGDTLQVVCTDPGALNDIPAWCRINGHRIVSTARDDDEVIIVVEVGHGK